MSKEDSCQVINSERVMCEVRDEESCRVPLLGNGSIIPYLLLPPQSYRLLDSPSTGDFRPHCHPLRP